MLTRRQATVFFAAFALAPNGVRAEDDPEMRMLEDAKTRADHAALAAHFREEATKARAKQAHHRLMAQAYAGKQGFGSGRLHCRRLAKEYGAMADEYDALAKLHAEAESKAP
jgi:hypothetical protein